MDINDNYRNAKTMKNLEKGGIKKAYNSIRLIPEEARSRAYHAVNSEIVMAHWQIGKIIVEEEQNGKAKAEYGKYLIKELSIRLSKEYGRGFDISNLWYFRQFYTTFQILDAVRRELSWTHYRLLLRVENHNARDFYIIEAINNNWSTRELERQINSLFYERIALSKDKAKTKELSKKGQIIKEPKDIIKDQYFLEFLGLKEEKSYLEKDIESALIDKLKDFVLELGKGFSFVARQKRISIDGDNYYVDLVFYNFILKCFVLIDLKIGKLTPQDIGQMDFYARYFEKEEKIKSDNPTVGLILCSDKNETMAKYTLLNETNRLFASKYKLYLPSESYLQEELAKERKRLENND